MLALSVLVAIEFRERRRSQQRNSPIEQSISQSASLPEGCCGEHLVCERETLLNSKSEIVYYDDQELDCLAGIAPSEFTASQHDMIMEVFTTLQEAEVAGWCRSLQLRNIELPEDIREQALLIVRELRIPK